MMLQLLLDKLVLRLFKHCSSPIVMLCQALHNAGSRATHYGKRTEQGAVLYLHSRTAGWGLTHPGGYPSCG